MNDVLAASYRFCGKLSRREAKNFYYSFLLLPPARKRAMCALYAFMRRTDDLADQPGEPERKRESLASWREELGRALGGETRAWAGWPALADTVRRHAIPHRYLNEVIDGVLMDVEPRPFESFDDLYRYCYHVASAVGLCCIHIWGFRSENGQAERLAEVCGIALQLTNILRDVGEDARLGRIYIPRQELARFGVAPDQLTSQRAGEAARRLFAFEGERAYQYYREAGSLVRLVSPVGRPVLRAIVGIYRSLLDEIARRDYDVLGSRVALPPWRKTAITLRSLIG